MILSLMLFAGGEQQILPHITCGTQGIEGMWAIGLNSSTGVTKYDSALIINNVTYKVEILIVGQ